MRSVVFLFSQIGLGDPFAMLANPFQLGMPTCNLGLHTFEGTMSLEQSPELVTLYSGCVTHPV